ncbi:hypothetical protein GMLC_15470 [Geomonas limicola]|uniref:Uncharacterized protein n=1 Tax=Geomonas limicola TaxID=2740186 RepID=A0A6V8N5X8_9BACT|nr:hypothetical protein [Geomonas limicola]GFO67968.1 hypothetical protein GMLC_15470 [Geomonas limicola]
MDIRKYSKQEIAQGQIETALELFFAKGDLFSAITLAGAAEEILVQLNELKKGQLGLAEKVASLFEILRPATKKRDGLEKPSRFEAETVIHMDARHEAVFLLGRAIEEYVTLTGEPTPLMLRFLSEVAVRG